MPSKIVLDIDDDTWKLVKYFKEVYRYDTLNDATVALVKRGLRISKKISIETKGKVKADART
jgi:hypothetical protein